MIWYAERWWTVFYWSATRKMLENVALQLGLGYKTAFRLHSPSISSPLNSKRTHIMCCKWEFKLQKEENVFQGRYFIMQNHPFSCGEVAGGLLLSKSVDRTGCSAGNTSCFESSYCSGSQPFFSLACVLYKIKTLFGLLIFNTGEEGNHMNWNLILYVVLCLPLAWTRVNFPFVSGIQLRD